jgi:hypothetical protein
VKTGEVVWNQVCPPSKKMLEKNPDIKKPYPDFLTDDCSQHLLIYNSNIVDCKLVLDNIHDKEGRKKQYVKKTFNKTPTTGPAILINRGYGNVYAFNFILLKTTTFFAENHVNMILPKGNLSKEQGLLSLEQVKKSFKDPRTLQFIEKYIGNGALSADEIESVLPIYTE